MQIERPNLSEYTDYRVFLRDMLAYLNKTGPKVSIRAFNRSLGFKSHNMIHLVLGGKRNLSPESVQKICQYLKLNKSQSKFFSELVLLNQAKSVDERKFHANELAATALMKKVKPIQEAQMKYLTHWFYAPIRELVRLSDFSENPEWIVSRITPTITVSQARKAVEEMIELGLLKRNEQGKLEQTSQFLKTQDGLTTHVVPEYHEQMIKKSLESIKNFPVPERNLLAVTLSLSDENRNAIWKMIDEFSAKLFAVAKGSGEPTGVYQVNVQLFPMTRPSHEN